MTAPQRTYTMDELGGLSGFDRRTIAYYVQEGLLPKIGRRGPRTRYPQLFLDRLLFIKTLREQEAAGELDHAMTLAEIREFFERRDDAAIAAAATARARPDRVASPDQPWLEDGLPEADAPPPPLMTGPPPAMASAGRRARALLSAEPPAREAAPPEDSELSLLRAAHPDAALSVEQEPPHHRLGELLRRVQQAAGRRRWERGSEHWTRAAITRDITISARDLDEQSAHLLEQAAELLRRLMRRRGR